MLTFLIKSRSLLCHYSVTTLSVLCEQLEYLYLRTSLYSFSPPPLPLLYWCDGSHSKMYDDERTPGSDRG